MNISTILELENWMAENNVKNTFTPKYRFASDEGLGLEKIDDLYVWYFVERGERQNLEYFRNENKAAKFVYEFLISGQPY